MVPVLPQYSTVLQDQPVHLATLSIPGRLMAAPATEALLTRRQISWIIFRLIARERIMI